METFKIFFNLLLIQLLKVPQNTTEYHGCSYDLILRLGHSQFSTLAPLLRVS